MTHPLARPAVVATVTAVVTALSVVGVTALLGVELSTPVLAAIVGAVTATVTSGSLGRAAPEDA